MSRSSYAPALADIDPICYQPKVGSSVQPDEWMAGGYWLQPSDWDRAAFRIPTGSSGPIKSLACNVVVTGRTLQYRHEDWYVRVKIVFPGDCEADQETTGWMLIRDWWRKDA